jgi:hypothetical protein
VRALRQLLREHTFDLRRLDVAGFRDWLNKQLAHWQHDPVFVQRVKIRDLRRAEPRLQAVEEAHIRAVLADEAAPAFARLRSLEQMLFDTAKAITGLTTALATAPADRQGPLQEKLAAFQSKQQELQEEQARLVQASPQRQALLRSTAQLTQLRAELGLDREEAQLESLHKQQGRRSGHSGSSFEDIALNLTQTYLVPDLLASSSAGASARTHILRGVTLGAARTEFDQLVVRRSRGPEQPVEVLAMIEVKRNINDLAHGFRQRQDNLAWFTGDRAKYDPQTFRTNYFQTGHFDRPASHQHQGDTFLFTPASFRLFRRDAATGLFLDRLCFITRVGTMWGIATADLSRIGYRVATDEGWNLDSDEYLQKLLHWCQSLPEALEAPDVLQMYTTTPRRARHILVTGR